MFTLLTNSSALYDKILHENLCRLCLLSDIPREIKQTPFQLNKKKRGLII